MTDDPEDKQDENEYAYMYLTCGRKAYHYDDELTEGWEEVAFERFDYTESYVFRKKKSQLTDRDRDNLSTYGEPSEEWVCPSSWELPEDPNPTAKRVGDDDLSEEEWGEAFDTLSDKQKREVFLSAHSQNEELVAKVSTLRKRVEELELLADGRLKELAQARLRKAGPSDDGFQFDIQATIVPLIAEHLAETMKNLGGENYVSFEVEHDELGPMELTLRKRSGEMPATKASRLESENATLREERDRLDSKATELVEAADTVFEIALAEAGGCSNEELTRLSNAMNAMQDELDARAALSSEGDGDGA